MCPCSDYPKSNDYNFLQGSQHSGVGMGGGGGALMFGPKFFFLAFTKKVFCAGKLSSVSYKKNFGKPKIKRLHQK